MSWRCRIIENPELDEDGFIDFSKREIGDMWYLELSPEQLEQRREHFSDQYFQHNSHRKPLVVKLPGPTYFVVDGKYYNGQQGYHGGWTVSGSPPNITLTPSIHAVGRYHGYINNGEITDDVDGKKYDERGRELTK